MAITPERKERISAAEYGSDVFVDVLRDLGIEFIALNPGSTFRGLHDSLVNYGGGTAPELVLCTHEEVAVAIAHGYARAAGKPMAAAAHDIVGLLHASMAIFNAWLDRAGVLVLGATGPAASEQRRPWIDWIHTAQGQGEVVRNFVKWDDQPASIPAAVESLVRAHHIVTTEPQGPVYVCFDAADQEQRLSEPFVLPDLSRFPKPTKVQADPAALEQAAELLLGAQRPVVVVDYLGRSIDAVEGLIRLTESLSLPVLDIGDLFSFPNRHPLNATGAAAELLAEADVVLALDVYDLEQALTTLDAGSREARDFIPSTAKVVDISLRQFAIKSWAHDQGKLYPVHLSIVADTALAVPALADLCARQAGDALRIAERLARITALHDDLAEQAQGKLREAAGESPISLPFLAQGVWEAVQSHDWVLAFGELRGWPRRLWDISQPYQYHHTRAGAGLGRGMGQALGVTLANRGRDRLCINFQPDGDLLFTPSALWTAAHHRIPLLTVMYNNRSYFNDEQHQAHVATVRGRPIENKDVGIRIEEPVVDFAAMARSFGVHGEGPVTRPEELAPALARALKVVVEDGLPTLVDVVTQNI